MSINSLSERSFKMEVSKRKLQKENTRQKILDTAYQVYSTHGFSATTGTIAKATGISHGALFVHFPTKKDLLTTLLDEFSLKIGQTLHEVSETAKDVESLLVGHIKVLKEYELFYTSIISDLSALPEEVKTVWISIQTTTAFHFSKIFKKEKVNKKIKNLPTHMLFNTWLGLIHYYLLNRELFTKKEESVLTRYENELIYTYVQLIKEVS